MIRKVERKIKAKYRKMCGWCFLIALVIGFVLGFLFARLLFPARTQVVSAVPTSTPVAAAPVATDAPELVVPTVEATQPATPTPTPEPTPTPSPTVNVLEQVGDYFGLSADDLASLREEKKDIEVRCQFCDAVYNFTPEEIAALNAPEEDKKA